MPIITIHWFLFLWLIIKVSPFFFLRRLKSHSDERLFEITEQILQIICIFYWNTTQQTISIQNPIFSDVFVFALLMAKYTKVKKRSIFLTKLLTFFSILIIYGMKIFLWQENEMKYWILWFSIDTMMHDPISKAHLCQKAIAIFYIHHWYKSKRNIAEI